MHLWEADIIAANAHEGQSDKIGVPYIRHVRAVAAGLAPFSTPIQVAGVLHDVIEDTGMTLERLAGYGVTKTSLDIIEAVTKDKGATRKQQIEKVIRGGYAACLVKTSDNAHNSRPDRLANLDERTRGRLGAKYGSARRVLWEAAVKFDWGPEYFDDTRKILSIVNDSLLLELDMFLNGQMS